MTRLKKNSLKLNNMKQILTLIFITSIIFSCKPKQELYLIETEMGNMKVKLYDSTPQHRDNFIKHVEENYYDGLLFHRVINQFMVQGGDPDSKGAPPSKRLGGGGPGYQIPAEIGAFHFKGTLAAARTQNPEKKSSGSQFYIVHGKQVTDAELDQFSSMKGITYSQEDRARYKKDGGAIFLDNEYTVFGEVVEGFDVIDKIAATPTAPGDRPVKDVTMKISKTK